MNDTNTQWLGENERGVRGHVNVRGRVCEWTQAMVLKGFCAFTARRICDL